MKRAGLRLKRGRWNKGEVEVKEEVIEEKVMEEEKEVEVKEGFENRRSVFTLRSFYLLNESKAKNIKIQAIHSNSQFYPNRILSFVESFGSSS